ncbi:MAG: hypothetical protein SFV54_11225 [Bryobacteraceae bacterium]|nr:hypothetical protein [Bryobacteraceae bacterium]
MATAVPLKSRQELVRRILASRHFAHAESLRRIVVFLFENASEKEQEAPREQEIAVQALGRPASFDPKIDPIVRVSMASVRERLQAYFEQEGRGENLRVALPKGHYRLEFEHVPGEASRKAAADTQARRKFWAPYLSPDNPNLLIFTEVLFFRDDEGGYFRNIYVNDRVTGAEELRARVGLPAEKQLSPSYHFVSAGEMNCLLSLTRTFAELGASLEFRNSRFFSWSASRRANMILLGSARINPFVRSLQGNLPLIISTNCIEERDSPEIGEPQRWVGQRQRDGDLERMIEFALVTRRPGPVEGTTLTMIGANHGRAIEGAGRFLTEESHVRSLDEAFGGALPEYFQLLLRVEMLDYDEEVVDVAYVTHRVLGKKV